MESFKERGGESTFATTCLTGREPLIVAAALDFYRHNYREQLSDEQSEKLEEWSRQTMEAFNSGRKQVTFKWDVEHSLSFGQVIVALREYAQGLMRADLWFQSLGQKEQSQQANNDLQLSLQVEARFTDVQNINAARHDNPHEP